MITYVSLLQHVGVIDTLAEQALALGAPLLVALVLCYVIGVGSAFASSTALLTAFIPLAGPLLATSSLSASGTVAALAIAATVVDVSPFSTDGALVVANAREDDRQRVYKQLMIVRGRRGAGRPGPGLGTAGTHRHHVSSPAAPDAGARARTRRRQDPKGSCLLVFGEARSVSAARSGPTCP